MDGQAGSALSPFQRPEDDASNAAAIAVLQQIDRVGTLLSTFTLTEIDLARLGSGLGILPANLTALLTARDQAALQKIWDRTSHYAQWRDRFPFAARCSIRPLPRWRHRTAPPGPTLWSAAVAAAGASAASDVSPSYGDDQVTPAVELTPIRCATLIAIGRPWPSPRRRDSADQLGCLANDLERGRHRGCGARIADGRRRRTGMDPTRGSRSARQLNDRSAKSGAHALVALSAREQGPRNKEALFSEFLIDRRSTRFW
ncbi:hypothetical protein F2981_32735 (plasmid) [Sinorhizobium meliloti]|nr:hypothetical protein [Sinorhizobium meliloti]